MTSTNHYKSLEAFDDFLLPPINPNSRIKVSVAMITYNHEAYIRQAIESVLMQKTNFPIELVIGEDCSTDNTRQIIQEYERQYPEKVRLLLHEHNQGMLRNFVQTLSACQGQYVSLLEGDDYWTSPSKLQKQVDILDNHPECVICGHSTICFDEKENLFSKYGLHLDEGIYTLEDLLVRNFISTCSVIYRNRLVNIIPSWFFSLKLGDWPLHIMNAKHGNIYYVGETMGVYRIHPSGVWSSENYCQRISYVIDMLEKIKIYLGSKYSTLIDGVIAYYCYDLFVLNKISVEESSLYAKRCLSEQKIREDLKNNRGLIDYYKVLLHAYSPRIYKKIRIFYRVFRKMIFFIF